MSNHSPSPWRFDRIAGFEELAKRKGVPLLAREGYMRGNDGSWCINDANGYGVASATMRADCKRGKGYSTPDPEGQANARLISAAPELLAACEAVMAADASAPRLIRAALAKAKGDE